MEIPSRHFLENHYLGLGFVVIPAGGRNRIGAAVDYRDMVWSPVLPPSGVKSLRFYVHCIPVGFRGHC